jgi:hypothetical protein
MTRLESFKELVRSHGHLLTLGEILRTEHAAEYRKQITRLRHEGWSVVCVHDRTSPGRNSYGFIETVAVHVEKGQRCFA